MKVVYTPEFLESMADVPADEKEDALKALDEMIKALEHNPYAGTPMYGGPLMVFWNWIRRNLYEIKFFLGLR